MIKRLFCSKLFVLYLILILVGFLVGYAYAIITSGPKHTPSGTAGIKTQVRKEVNGCCLSSPGAAVNSAHEEKPLARKVLSNILSGKYPFIDV